MALSFGGLQSNIGPFRATSLKGNGFVHGVPMFVDKLPMTIGGIAGEDLYFGRLCSVNPANRRQFVLGVPEGNVVKGISMLDPAKLTLDPGQQTDSNSHYYFTGEPATLTTLGVLDILEWDMTQSAPFEGAKVFARKDNGMLAFASTDISGTDYIALNASVYETLDPNGAKVFFNYPLAEEGGTETLVATAEPVAEPEAGAVDAGTQVTLKCDDANALIFYTLDGETPTMESTRYSGPITITAACTLKAIAIAEGKNKSTVLSAAYTIA